MAYKIGESSAVSRAVRDKEVSRFYSDTLSDTPMAKVVRESYIVRGSIIEPGWAMRCSLIEDMRG